VTPLQRYLAEEVAEDHADGLITRREALRRLALIGLGAAAAGSLLAACARSEQRTVASPTASRAPQTTSVRSQAITFDGPDGRTLFAAWAEATDPRGGVLVIHENRGLNDHIRDVAGRFAAAGYSALAIDLLSEEGGTAEVGGDAEAMAALSSAPEPRLVADMKAGVGELERRLPEKKLAAVGFCFGGGMVWRLLASGEPRLSAAAPFYGPAPDDPDFSGSSNVAVLGIYAELDDRVNATRETTKGALEDAGLTHEIVTFPGADHAFFNDTGPRYNAEQADRAWKRVHAWFERHLG
jgi:carboxymethylenebutenolidase